MTTHQDPISIESPDTWFDTCNAYRKRHGPLSLATYVGRGRHFVCKHKDDTGAVLVEIGTHAELMLNAKEFEEEFFLCFLDEAAFYFGTEESQASAAATLNAEVAARQFCIDQDLAKEGS